MNLGPQRDTEGRKTGKAASGRLVTEEREGYQRLEREHPATFQSILKRIAAKIPGINHIDTKRTDNGRLLLRFNDSSFRDPYYSQQMSDGTFKAFAYLLCGRS